MAEKESGITRERLAELLNEDLSREYQAVIAYVVYSQVLKGAAVHEYRGPARSTCQAGTRSRPHHFAPDRLSRDNARRDAQGSASSPTIPSEMLRFDLNNEN